MLAVLGGVDSIRQHVDGLWKSVVLQSRAEKVAKVCAKSEIHFTLRLGKYLYKSDIKI